MTEGRTFRVYSTAVGEGDPIRLPEDATILGVESVSDPAGIWFRVIYRMPE